MVDIAKFNPFRQGAEAKLYTGTFLGRPALVKERFSKKYRHPELDVQLTRDRLKGEVRSLIRCKTIGVRTPDVYLADAETAVIVMEHLAEHITCREYIQRHLDTDRAKMLALGPEIGRTVAKLHENGIIHGDLTTSNLMVRSEGDDLCVIDFGLGFAEGSPEDKGVDLYVLERALLSTHPRTEFLFEEILNAYKKQCKKDVTEVIKKYEEIRMRGRKRTMVG